MLTMTPLSITAEGQIEPKVHRYRVRFDHDGKEVADTWKFRYKNIELGENTF